MARLHIDKLNKSYGPPGARRHRPAIEDGEFVVLVGPSGCGKSTLLRMIAGLDAPTSGDIYIADRMVNALAPAERKIAMVFQSYALYPHMDVRKNMTFGLKFTGVEPAERDRRVAEAARMLRLEPLLARYPRDLSGGQRQRVAIGRAIVREPDVFLFDEPLSNLDAALRVSTRVEIARLHRLLEATMVYVTHDQIEAMTLADRIVVMNQGRIEQVGKPLDLYYTPANLFVAGFIGSPAMNFFPATVERVEGGEARGERGFNRASDPAGRSAEAGRPTDHRGKAGASRPWRARALHRDRPRRTRRAPGRGVLRARAARRRETDGGRDPRTRNALSGQTAPSRPGRGHSCIRRAADLDAGLFIFVSSHTLAATSLHRFNLIDHFLVRRTVFVLCGGASLPYLDRRGRRLGENCPALTAFRLTASGYTKGGTHAQVCSSHLYSAGLILARGAPAFANALDFAASAGFLADPARNGSVRRPRVAGHDHRPHRRAPALLRPAGSSGAEIRRRRRPAGLHLVGRHPNRQQARMAGLDAAGADAEAPSRSAAPHGGRHRQSARRARHVSRPARSIASTAPTSPTRSGRRFRPAASA